MPEDVAAIPLEGPGSRTPSALPSLHTAVGEGAKSTGVNNVGKPKGLPGAPTLEEGGAGGLGGTASPEIQTPEDLLLDRSKDRLIKDLEDIYIVLNENDNLETSTKHYDFNKVEFSTVVDKLINQKGWHVDRLKELLPSRDEKIIKEQFNTWLNSSNADNVDVDQQENNTLNMFNNKKGSNNLMKTVTDLIIDNGAIKLAGAKSGAERLAAIDASVRKVRAARKNLKKAFLANVGRYALAGGFGDEGVSIDEETPSLSQPFDDFDDFDDLGAEGDLESKIDSLKTMVEDLSDQIRSLSDSPLEDISLKDEDASIAPAKDEIKGATKDLDIIDNFDIDAKDKKDKNSFDKKDSAEGKDDLDTKKEASVPTGGKAVTMPAEAKHKGGKPSTDSSKAMDVTTGKSTESKEAYLADIKEKLAKLKAIREKSAFYPDTDVNKQEVDGIMEDTAKSQASEINSDMSGGFAPDTDSLSPQGIVEKVKDPGMEVSKDANIQKAASVDDFNKVTAAANSLSRKAVAQAVAKTRIAMEVSSIQQLKGLLVNPLKSELVARFAEYGVDQSAAQAIVHNAFVTAYEDSQKIVIAEAFDVLANKEDNEFVKVAAFTKDFKGALSEEDNTSSTDDESILANKEASAEAKTVKTASLRGSQVNIDNSQVYTGFWRAAYKEGKGN